jgi:hypothetical protein
LEEKKEISPIKDKNSDSEGESSSEDESDKKKKNLPPAGPTGYDYLMNLGFALKKTDPSFNTRKQEESSDEDDD